MESVETAKDSYWLRLVEIERVTQPHSIYVTVSHSELDGLVGRMMQMCDLIGDPQQRKALKDTIKRNCRDWMNDQYESAGYDQFGGVRKGVEVHKIK